jgi:hypothetical protein
VLTSRTVAALTLSSAVLATLTVSAVVLAAPAAAQTVAVNGTCFVNANPALGAPVTVSGSGFNPGDSIDLGAPLMLGTVMAATDGTFTTTVTAPTLSTSSPAEKRFTLTASDPTAGQSATTSFRVANLAFRTTPAVAKPTARVRFSFSGFRAGKRVYGHYLLHGKDLATASFGRTSGPCGMLTASARLFPGRHPKFGRYKVQFDDSRRYVAHAVPRIVSALTISRR